MTQWIQLYFIHLFIQVRINGKTCILQQNANSREHFLPTKHQLFLWTIKSFTRDLIIRQWKYIGGKNVWWDWTHSFILYTHKSDHFLCASIWEETCNTCSKMWIPKYWPKMTIWQIIYLHIVNRKHYWTAQYHKIEWTSIRKTSLISEVIDHV